MNQKAIEHEMVHYMSYDSRDNLFYFGDVLLILLIRI